MTTNIYEIELSCHRELLPSILVQNLLNAILTFTSDLRERVDDQLIHHFKPTIVGDAEVFEQLLLYYEWCNFNNHPSHLLLRMTIKILPNRLE